MEALEAGDEEMVKRTRRTNIRDHEQCQASGLAWSILTHITAYQISPDEEVVNSIQRHLEKLVCPSEALQYQVEADFL